MNCLPKSRKRYKMRRQLVRELMRNVFSKELSLKNYCNPHRHIIFSWWNSKVPTEHSLADQSTSLTKLWNGFHNTDPLRQGYKSGIRRENPDAEAVMLKISFQTFCSWLIRLGRTCHPLGPSIPPSQLGPYRKGRPKTVIFPIISDVSRRCTIFWFLFDKLSPHQTMWCNSSPAPPHFYQPRGGHQSMYWETLWLKFIQCVQQMLAVKAQINKHDMFVIFVVSLVQSVVDLWVKLASISQLCD